MYSDLQWCYSSILSADPPKLTQHPKDQSVSIGAKIAFQVEATGDDLYFQWQRNQSDLDDSDRCCGTHTNRLRIIEVEMSDKGRYRCLVKNSVGNEFSHEAFLIVSKLVMCSSTLGNGFNVGKWICVNLICISTSLCGIFLQNPLLQFLVLRSQLVSCLTPWVSSTHLHSSCSVKACKDIRHLFHINQVLNVGC